MDEVALLLSAKDEQIRALREVAKQLARQQRVESWALNLLRHVYRSWADYTLVRAVQRDEARARREEEDRQTDVRDGKAAAAALTLPIPSKGVLMPSRSENGALTERDASAQVAKAGGQLHIHPRDFSAEAQVRRQCAKQAERILELEMLLDNARSEASTARSEASTARAELEGAGRHVAREKRYDELSRERNMAEALEQSKRLAREAERERAAAELEAEALREELGAAEEARQQAEAEARALRKQEAGLRAQLEGLGLELAAAREGAPRARGREGEAPPRPGRLAHTSESRSPTLQVAPTAPTAPPNFEPADPHAAAWALAWAAGASAAQPVWAPEALAAMHAYPAMPPVCRPVLRRAQSFDRLLRAPGVRLNAEAFGWVSPQHGPR